MEKSVRLAAIDELDGPLNRFDVDGEEIAVAAVDGRYYAFEGACPHRHCSLSEGEMLGTTVVCPCHGSEFDVITGRRLAGPARRDIRTYPALVQDGQLEILR